MNISRKWLSRYLDINTYSALELQDMLTSLGLEVEGFHEVESIKGGLKGLVTGHVLTCEKHENADKLSVTTIDVGTGENLQIVCGAPNVEAGQKVIVALEGAQLYPSVGEPFTIKRSKIRGVESQGMICAEDEIGLGSSHAGIMVLDQDVPVGQLASKLFNVSTDTVFEIGLTPNRSDATCHLGVARDLFAYLTINKNYNSGLQEPGTQGFHIDNTGHTFQVDVRHADCIRYSGLTLTGVQIGPSPKWLKDLLGNIGVKSINNVVDITNFILHEYGQPLHAFDADKLIGGKLIVEKLPQDTPFLALDDKIYKLKAGDLMICDAESQPLCIAGVYGGKDSGITDATTTLFLESAHFSAQSVRKTSMSHNLRTDAAKVFEKGSDPNITVIALKRAAILLVEHAGATVSSELVDEYSEKINPSEIVLKYQKVRDLIGNSIPDETINNVLQALNMGIRKVDQDSLMVTVPTNKVDVKRDVDLVEEILRVYGFNNVPIPSKVVSNISYKVYPDARDVRNKILNLLASNGFHEMMGLSLVESRSAMEVFGIPENEIVFINNTSNISLDAMRPDMLLSGLKSVMHNINRQMLDIKLCEFGKSYRRKDQAFEEKEVLTLIITGKTQSESWHDQSRDNDFFDIKKHVLKVLKVLGITNYKTSELEEDVRFAYGLSFRKGNMQLVNFGLVNPSIAKGMDVKQKVYYAEFDFDSLLNCLQKNVEMSNINKFPFVVRDLAIVVKNEVKFEDLETIASKYSKKLLKSVDLFDVYKNEQQLGKDNKSLALRFVFENDEKTLTEDVIESEMHKIKEQFEGQFNASVRS